MTFRRSCSRCRTSVGNFPREKTKLLGTLSVGSGAAFSCKGSWVLFFLCNHKRLITTKEGVRKPSAPWINLPHCLREFCSNFRIKTVAYPTSTHVCALSLSICQLANPVPHFGAMQQEGGRLGFTRTWPSPAWQPGNADVARWGPPWLVEFRGRAFTGQPWNWKTYNYGLRNNKCDLFSFL